MNDKCCVCNGTVTIHNVDELFEDGRSTCSPACTSSLTDHNHVTHMIRRYDRPIPENHRKGRWLVAAWAA